MRDLDLSISNGTCYFATNRKAAKTFIPCGNAANAAYTCCLKGDVCLEGSSCFHPDGNSGGTTYIAGCTDPGFGSVAGACPHKGAFADQQIVGLVRCQESNDQSTPDELWAGCPGDKAKTEMTGVPSPCSCSDPIHQGLFRQKPTIGPVATLPTALMQTILFEKNHEPSLSFATSASWRGSSAATPRSTTTTMNLPTTTSEALVTDVPASAQAADQGLSAGTKAGIAVGVILAVLLSTAIIFLALTVRRRHRKSGAGAGGAGAATTPPPPLPADPAREIASELPEPAAPVAGHAEWFKPELAADDTTTISSPDPAAAAVAPTEIGSGQHNQFDSRSSSSTCRNSPPPSSEHQTKSSMHDSRGSSVVSDTSSGCYPGGFQAARRSPFSVSPQHSGAPVVGVAGNEGGGRAAKAMEPISELQG